MTKIARDMQGLYVTDGTETEERGFGALRYGGQLDEHTRFRVYGKDLNRDSMELHGSRSGHDDWDFSHGGIRIDRDMADDI